MILFPGDYGTDEYEAPSSKDGDYYYYDDGEYGVLDSFDPTQHFSSCEGQCRLMEDCGAGDFNGTSMPAVCGWDEEEKRHLFCCSEGGAGIEKMAAVLGGVNYQLEHTGTYYLRKR